jgi:hypothetical protein
VVHFLRDVGKVYSELPLLPSDLDIVILRPRGSEGVEQMSRQFRRRFRVRRAAVEAWLKFLQPITLTTGILFGTTRISHNCQRTATSLTS